MKLDEVFQTEVRAAKVKKALDADKLSNRYKRSDVMAGSFASVIRGTDPHAVIKASHEPEVLQNDPYFIYVSRIVDEHLAQANPYFPRIYKINLAHDEEGKVLYHINMESLIPASQYQVESDDAWALVERMLDVDFLQSYEVGISLGNPWQAPRKIKFPLGHYTELKDMASTRMILDWFLWAIARYIQCGDQYAAHIVDSNLCKAVDLIKEIKESNSDFEYDWHIGNIMFRRGPYLQLVIIDPLYNQRLHRERGN